MERLYDKVAYFKGKHYRYKIIGEMLGQGQVKHTYYRKLRRRFWLH